MITETREIYKCGYCRKVYQIKSFAIKHESNCRKNPTNKSKCFEGCKYLIKKEIEWTWFDYNGYDHQVDRVILYCNKKKEGVFPIWINGYSDADISIDDRNDIPNNIMPKECKYFKDIYIQF